MQKISLPISLNADWKKELLEKLIHLNSAQIHLDCNNWKFYCRDIRELSSMIQKSGATLALIQSNVPETVISACALGIRAVSDIPDSLPEGKDSIESKTLSRHVREIKFHQGTLRSGDHLTSDGDVLLLGDVNPGARISAKGNVMIWGRLRGIAHAGCEGKKTSKIIALQLRPVQLRIAELIARGPKGNPEEGLAEQARIDNGRIIIEPASTKSIGF